MFFNLILPGYFNQEATNQMTLQDMMSSESDLKWCSLLL